MPAVVKSSLALHLLPFLLLVATDDAAVFNITNSCSYTVWPAATPVGGGTELKSGQKWTINVPAGTSSGRLWGRTGCSFNQSGLGEPCERADCGGVLSCPSTSNPKTPVTFAEFTLGAGGAGAGAPDFFDLTMLDGFNLPMALLAQGPGCSSPVLRCDGNSKSQCPDAYMSPTDNIQTHSCPANTNYDIIFCPPSDLQAMPPTVNTQPSRTARKKSPFTVSMLVVILATIGSLILVFVAIFFICKRRARHRDEIEQAEDFGELQGSPMRFTFQQLKVATEDFKDKLGEGGFGLLPCKQLSSKGRKLEKLEGRIQYADVSFSYPSRPTVPILGRLNLTLNPNEVVAIVGLSGSGKSTIVNLLLRLYEPTNGQILIDGVPLTELDIRWFRERIGFVGQEPRLFRMDISSNIKYGCPREVSHEEVVWAAKQAYAHDFIMSLPNGYNTIVDDALLSGGQKQRVAIARALLRDPSILLLDEATSALDAESEHYVKSVITKVSHDSKAKRTAVIIAHRLSTIQTADRIIVMENGNIVEDGKHSELIDKDGLYSRLARRQNEVLQ